MSASNPLSASTVDQKPREPSMEEILASIRRIIADDQSLPGRGVIAGSSSAPSLGLPVDDASAPPPPQAAFAPNGDQIPVGDVRVAAEPPRREAQIAPREPADTQVATMEQALDAVRQHGIVAAPQFAMPDGPANDGDHFEESPQADEPEALDPISLSLAEVGAVADAPIAAHTERSNATGHPDHDEQLYETPLDREHEDELEEKSDLFSAATDSSIQSAFNMLAATRLADNSDELKAMVREMIRPLLRSWLDDNLPSMVERMVRAEIERVARGGR